MYGEKSMSSMYLNVENFSSIFMVLARTIREKQDLGCMQDICNHIIQENILNGK